MTFYERSTPARWDSFAGMIPCRVLEINESTGEARIQITKRHGPYKAGEVITTLAHHVVPARAVVCRGSVEWIRRSEWYRDDRGVLRAVIYGRRGVVYQ